MTSVSANYGSSPLAAQWLSVNLAAHPQLSSELESRTAEEVSRTLSKGRRLLHLCCLGGRALRRLRFHYRRHRLHYGQQRFN